MKRKQLKYKEEIPEPINSSADLDKIDRKILNILQDDNQITNLALAEKIGISAPPCFRRVKRLRDEGIITKDVSLIDPFKLGDRNIVFVTIVLEKTREDLLDHFERKIMEQPEVLQCYFVSGETDYILLIHVNDVHHYNNFVRRVFTSEANIRMFRSSFCLTRVKYSTHIPLSEE